MATIEKRERKSGTVYKITVLLGRDASGKRITKQTTFTPTKKTEKAIEKEVRDFAAIFEQECKKGAVLDGRKLKFHQVVEKWRDDWAVHNIADQGAEYIRLINKTAIPEFGHLAIADIKPAHINKIISDMRNRGLKNTTIKKTIAAINSVFRYATRNEIIDRNPIDREKMEMPKLSKKRVLHTFTPEQASIFLDAVSESYEGDYKQETPVAHKKAFYTLAIYSGMRRGELCALTWHDIDFRNSTVTVNKAMANRKGGAITKKTKTESGNRTIQLPFVCVAVLKRWYDEERQLRQKLGSLWAGAEEFDDTNIFIQWNGASCYVTSWTQNFKRIIRRHNANCTDESMILPEIRLHDLRHTFASISLKNGQDLAKVSQRLGHSKISTTLDYYVEAIPDKEEDLRDAESLGNLIAVSV